MGAGYHKGVRQRTWKIQYSDDAICPGFFKSDVNIAISADPVFYNKITDRISLGRWGKADDLMGAAVFLASKASDYVNGADLIIDGGFATVL
jgi:2-deoxy-D-gluconate 3-dehydrogenase